MPSLFERNYDAKRSYRSNFALSRRDPQRFANKRVKHSAYFNEGFNEAYKAPDGIKVKRNPYTNEKEMFVSGSRGPLDWMSNVAETVGEGVSRSIPYVGPFVKPMFNLRRSYQESNIRKVADLNNVRNIYGHSRGAALASSVVDKYNVVGMDGAMPLARNKHILNIKSGIVGGLLGLTGNNNVTVGRNKEFHKPWTRR